MTKQPTLEQNAAMPTELQILLFGGTYVPLAPGLDYQVDALGVTVRIGPCTKSPGLDWDWLERRRLAMVIAGYDDPGGPVAEQLPLWCPSPFASRRSRTALGTGVVRSA